MEIAEWIVAALTRTDEWCKELENQRVAVLAEAPGPARLARMVELADAMEHVEPDRSRALALYLAAWRGGELGVRAQVLELAGELRAYLTLAEVAVADHEATRDPDRLVAAGRALIDGGLLQRATETFLRAAEVHGSLADAIAKSSRLADVRVALAIARFHKVDVEHEIEACLDRARAGGEGAAALYLQALRLVRLAKLDRRESILRGAVRACPGNKELGDMYADVLLDRGTADDFLAHHRARLEATVGEPAWVECVRGAAFELVLRDVHPGLGLRMLRTSLEHAYAARIGIRRHVAAWELLLKSALASRSTVALAPVLADGLSVPLPRIDALYIAQLGLQIAWRDANDMVAAQPYAAALLDVIPGHPVAAAFLSIAFPEPPPPEDPEPVLPTVTFKLPVISRVTSADLRRDASPIPAEPPLRADAAPRSPRKVVPVDAVVELPSGAFFSTVIRDLSTTGAFITTRRAIEIGTVVTLEIRLPSVLRVAERQLRCEARVVRRSDVGCGLAFMNPPSDLIAGITALTG
ncbi:MAG: PilZ domain-containing protein [Polyangiales bacterium]